MFSIYDYITFSNVGLIVSLVVIVSTVQQKLKKSSLQSVLTLSVYDSLLVAYSLKFNHRLQLKCIFTFRCAAHS